MINGLPLPAGASFWVAPPNPAAGADLTYTFLPGYEYLLLGVRMVWATSVVVATRYPSLLFMWFPGPVNFRISTNVGLVAVSASTYNWTPGQSFVETVTANSHQLTLPYPLIFKPGDRVHTSTDNMDVADQISSICICCLRMPLTQ